MTAVAARIGDHPGGQIDPIARRVHQHASPARGLRAEPGLGADRGAARRVRSPPVVRRAGAAVAALPRRGDRSAGPNHLTTLTTARSHSGRRIAAESGHQAPGRSEKGRA